ncbi:MAG TPA: hypothetical protein VLM85_27910, partial [Polyangiaceae bacterium]|nr:hypothetical protein [Polyangiaceae bacterium]
MTGPRLEAKVRANMRLAWSFVALLVTGCAAPTGFGSDGGNADDGGAGDGGSLFTEGGEGGMGSDGGTTVLYAHTNTTLYQLDPGNLAAPLVTIGDFDCIGGQGQATSMTDVAVDKDGALFAVSQIAAYPLAIQGGVVHCKATWLLPSNAAFYGLTFAPENTVAAAETLVAANDAGQIFSIDSQGQTTLLGNFGKDTKGNTYQLSGDIV